MKADYKVLALDSKSKKALLKTDILKKKGFDLCCDVPRVDLSKNPVVMLVSEENMPFFDSFFSKLQLKNVVLLILTHITTKSHCKHEILREKHGIIYTKICGATIYEKMCIIYSFLEQKTNLFNLKSEYPFRIGEARIRANEEASFKALELIISCVEKANEILFAERVFLLIEATGNSNLSRIKEIIDVIHMFFGERTKTKIDLVDNENIGQDLVLKLITI